MKRMERDWNGGFFWNRKENDNIDCKKYAICVDLSFVIMNCVCMEWDSWYSNKKEWCCELSEWGMNSVGSVCFPSIQSNLLSFLILFLVQEQIMNEFQSLQIFTIIEKKYRFFPPYSRFDFVVRFLIIKVILESLRIWNKRRCTSRRWSYRDSRATKTN